MHESHLTELPTGTTGFTSGSLRKQHFKGWRHPCLQAEGVRERLRSFCLHWSSQTLTVKKKELEMDSEGKKKKKRWRVTLKYEFPGMNFLSFQFTSLGSCDTSPLFSSLQPVSWLTEEEWTHTLLPTLPGLHPVPPRHAPCVILLRPLLLPAWKPLSGS